MLAKLHEEEGKAIIMVTHDPEVAEHADRVEFLKDGEIIKSNSRLKKLEKHYLRGEQDGNKKH